MGNVFLNLMDQDEVKKIIESLKIYRKIEKIDLSDVYQRILAEDIYAVIDLPPFDRAAMDGYAVRAQDTFGASEDNPLSLDLIEKIGAGDVPLKKWQKVNVLKLEQAPQCRKVLMQWLWLSSQI